MSFLEEFLLCLRWRPGQALLALYWLLLRRVVRARNILRRDSRLAPYAYKAWIGRVEAPRVASLHQRMKPLGENTAERPEFSVILTDASGSGRNAEAASIKSVLCQTWSDWELLVPRMPTDEIGLDARVRTIPCNPEASFPAAAISAARGEWIVWLAAGDCLPNWALTQYASCVREDGEAGILYGDHDHFDAEGGRTNPWFKPQWNQELALAQDYFSAACLMRAQLACDALQAVPAEEAHPYALALSAIAATSVKPRHVRQIQVHVGAKSVPAATLRMPIVQRHLADKGCDVTFGPFDTLRIDWPMPPRRPQVSIIIPTRDRIELLKNCIESVISHTSYLDYEIIVADNDSTEPATIEYFSSIVNTDKVRVVPCPGPFNFSEINNRAAQEARGSYLCFLNNDTEVISESWLEALLRQASRQEIGAAGAMLLYGDRTIQHAGVVIGLGGAAGHAHRHLSLDEPGYFAQAYAQRYVSAVTAACLMVRRDKFMAVGGFDAEDLAVAYNDVDLCLKLEKAGWHNVYVPQAQLFHHESKSRGDDLSPAHRERYFAELAVLKRRWQTVDYCDPLHHPDLDRRHENYAFTLEDHLA